MRLENKVAIVAGSASGIGQLIAIRFARERPAVIIDYVGNPDVPSKTGKEIASFGGKAIAVAADVSKLGTVITLIDADVEAKPEIEKALMSEIDRWGKPEEIAGLCVFLASDERVYVTGSAYFIDRGMLRQSVH